MTRTHNRILLGAHMSIAGGFEKSLERGESIGCTTIQIFTKSNRQWNAKPIDIEDAALFKKNHKTSAIDPIIAHASYLINCAAADQALYEKSVSALIDELERCQMLGIPMLVLHPGSATSQSKEDALARLISGLDEALNAAESATTILIETMAGQGSGLCSTFEEIAYVLESSSHKKRLAVCADTCHLYAAGYNISTSESYHATWQEFERIIGINHLKAIHLNDSLKPLNSRVDRHADIGRGCIGLEGFKELMNDPRFAQVPKILETPQTSDDAEIDYKRNMDLLLTLID